jgi:hypothetical protein
MIRNSTTRICSANEKNCTENAKNDFEVQQQTCGCLVPCNYIKYEFERNFDRFEFILSLNSKLIFVISYSRGPEFTVVMRIDVKILFGSDKVNNLIRKQQFNEIDFLSYIGGLLGLFAGFSVLSFIELVYWFLIRVCIVNDRKSSAKVYPFKQPTADLKTRFDIFRNYVENYLKESSIHGLSFIFDGKSIQR